MLFAFHHGELELRSEGGTTRLRATFPYGSETELAAGRREVFAPHAFAASIAGGNEVHFLSAHDFAKPLASRAAGTMQLRSTDASLEIEATIEAGTSWARDFLSAHAQGLVRGVSPGFTVSPGGERIERRGNGVLRTVTAAHLIELSAVTRPAYPQATIEARNWTPAAIQLGKFPSSHALARWRI